MSAQQGTSSAGGSHHRNKYKNAGLDSQEMRRRREEEGIQLRKQKREQQLFKRRNVTSEDVIQVKKVFRMVLDINTVWNLEAFSTTLILREIKVDELQCVEIRTKTRYGKINIFSVKSTFSTKEVISRKIFERDSVL